LIAILGAIRLCCSRLNLDTSFSPTKDNLVDGLKWQVDVWDSGYRSTHDAENAFAREVEGHYVRNFLLASAQTPVQADS